MIRDHLSPIAPALARSGIRRSLGAGLGEAPDGRGWSAGSIELLRPPRLWTKHEEIRRDADLISWGRIASALPHPVEITIRTRPPLRHAFIAWSPRGRLQRFRLDCAIGAQKRSRIPSHCGTVSGAVSSFLVICIGIANRGDSRFCGPRLPQTGPNPQVRWLSIA